MAETASAGTRSRREGSSWSIVAILLGVSTLNYLDRHLPFILAEPIKHDLGLSDTQIGLMGGLGFSLVFAAFSIPLARIADRRSPARVVALTLCVWSLMTMLTGFARDFLHLLIARIGVAIGEAGGTPPSHAVIARTVPRHRLSIALAVYGLGGPIGAMLGMIAGGWIAAHFGWRNAFIIAAVPGVVLALALLRFVKVPDLAQASQIHQPMIESAVSLMRDPAYRQIVWATTAFGTAFYGLMVFLPSTLVRTYQLPIEDVGLWLGLTNGIGGSMGMLLGGLFGDYMWRRDRRWRLWFCTACMLVPIPFLFLGLFAPSVGIAVVALCVPISAWAAFFPPMYAAVQETCSPANRATAIAVIATLSTLAGAVGPVIVGLISDSMASQYGADSLRFAVCFLVLPIIWAAVHFQIGAKRLVR